MDQDGVYEESLGSGLERQMSRVEEVQQALTGINKELPSLKTQCDKLKSDRRALLVEVSSHNANLASLRSEVEQLQAERDALRLEMKNEKDQNAWWSQYDRTSSATAAVSSTPEFDTVGKANRRIWLLEHQIDEMKREVEDAKGEAEEEVWLERAISEGLRDRIGRLEEKVRSGRRDLDESLGREKSLREELNDVKIRGEEEEKRLKKEWRDMRDALDKERAEARRLSEVNVALGEERRALAEEVRLSKLKPPTQSPPRPALQRRPSNIPQTPTKNAIFSPIPVSQTPLCHKTGSNTSPTATAKRYSALQGRHDTLKAEYDKLRTKYAEDIKHWKQWKEVETARKEEKKKRKEDKKAKRGMGATASEDVSTPAGPFPIHPTPEVLGSQRQTRSHAAKAKQADELLRSSQEEDRGQRSTSVTLPSQEDHISPVLHMDESHIADSVRPTQRASQRVLHVREAIQQSSRSLNVHTDPKSAPPPAVSRVREVIPPSPALNASGVRPTERTPMSTNTIKRRATTAARVTPWLGTPLKPIVDHGGSSTRSKQRFDPFDEDDYPPPQPGQETPTIHVPSTSKAGLVRDRGGNGEPLESLRKAALQRTTSIDSVRDRLRSETPTADTGQGKKRKWDMEGLSPAEKARELKKINKLPASEKRELYAAYKGKGRYLAPEDVEEKVQQIQQLIHRSTRVADEYEIDPERNEGANFQFHDVKRRRTERQQMHGGDCECCRGYYEAVGPLPRYNTAPAWNDVSPEKGADGDEEANTRMRLTDAQVKEHQNKVSRHRETWNRPPTPPGYWNIGFPPTQEVEEQNRRADEMIAEKEAKLRREAAHKGSKWRKKA